MSFVTLLMNFRDASLWFLAFVPISLNMFSLYYSQPFKVLLDFCKIKSIGTHYKIKLI
jgi:hypothetical protein